MRNAHLFNTIADLLTLDESLHDQTRFMGGAPGAPKSECGTTACIAGWACILGTNDFKFKKGRWQPKRKTVTKLGGTDNDWFDDIPTRIDYLVSNSYFDEVGGATLGLTKDERELLFSGGTGPASGHSVVSALRAIADGADIDDVWGDREFCDDCDEQDCDCDC